MNQPADISLIENFVNEYAEKLSGFEGEDISGYYNFPCTIIGDDFQQVLNSKEELEAYLNAEAVFYNNVNAARAIPDVLEVDFLSNRLNFVLINWTFRDASDNLIYECDYAYIVRTDETGYKICSVVSVNEQKRMEVIIRKRGQSV